MDFILPSTWVVKVTDENRSIINEWKKDQKYNLDLFENLDWNYVDYEGAGHFWQESENILEVFTIIPFEYFCNYVYYNSNINSKQSEDYNYLIPILNKIKN